MRISLPLKVTLLFLPLALAAVFFGLVVFYGFSLFDEMGEHQSLVEGFKLQLKDLEILQEQTIIATTPEQEEDFNREIARTIQFSAKLLDTLPHLDSEAQEQLVKLPLYLDNYNKAYHELFLLNTIEQEFPAQSARLIQEIHLKISQAGLQDTPRLLHLYNDLLPLQFEIYGQRKLEHLPNMQHAANKIISQCPNQEIVALTRQFVQQVEASYVNFLAIQNRRAFLEETGQLFFRIADESLQQIRSTFLHKKKMLTWAIVGITCAAIALVFLSLSFALRYLSLFLGNQRSAMRAIEDERYEFTLANVPDDEIGDLSLALQRLAGNLQLSQERLTDSERRYRGLVENIGDWVWEVDAQDRFTFSSQAVTGILGYTPEEMVGRDYFSFMDRAEALRVGVIVNTFRENSAPFSSLIIKHRHKDGSLVVMESAGRPVYDDNGNFQGYRGVNRDVTLRENAAKEQARLEEQLHHAQRLESVGRLASGIAHDFNNILSAINGYAELSLMKIGAEDPLKENLQHILESGRRAARLTQQLLAFGRKQMIDPEYLDLNLVVQETREMLVRLLGEDVEIVLLPGKDIPPVMMDRSQFEQVLVNIAVNARDAMPAGGRLTIETGMGNFEHGLDAAQEPLPPGDYVFLRIVDSGEGMSPELLKHIFEPFFTTKSKTKGTGLGLATVYGIVKQNGGEIVVSSTAGQGSSFTVYIPAAAQELLLAKAGVFSVSVEAMATGGEEVILLVEDETRVRKMVATTLKALDYSVLEAENGAEALRVAGEYHGRLDLLLTDVVMPKMGGSELAKEMTRLYPGLKVLFMSGYAEDTIVKQGVLRKDVNFIPKPVTPQTILRAVRVVLDA